jgi:hypothetical protein
MTRVLSVTAVLLSTLVGVSNVWAGGSEPEPMEPICCPCFYVDWTGGKTEFGGRLCFELDNVPTFEGGMMGMSPLPRKRLLCGEFYTDPVLVQCTVIRYIVEQRVKTVWWWGKQYEVTYNVYIPVQEQVQVEIPPLEGKWCGIDPCRYTTWKIDYRVNGTRVYGAGTTVGDNLYGKIYITGLPCGGIFKLNGYREECALPCEPR